MPVAMPMTFKASRRLELRKRRPDTGSLAAISTRGARSGPALRFGALEWHPTLDRLPDAIVREWDGGQYRIEFVEPLLLVTFRHDLQSYAKLVKSL